MSPRWPRATGTCIRHIGPIREKSSMAEPNEASVIGALRGVSGPDGRGDIVGLGMVSGVVVKQGNVGFAIEIDPARAAELEPLRAAAERAVQNLPGVLSVTAVLTAHRGAPAAQQKPQPQQAPRGGKALVPGVKHIVAVASGKGG